MYISAVDVPCAADKEYYHSHLHYTLNNAYVEAYVTFHHQICKGVDQSA